MNPGTGEYSSNFPNPTGIPADVTLSAHGVAQAKELGAHLQQTHPPVDAVYASPFYRVIQTLQPGVLAINAGRSEPLAVIAER